LPPEQVTDIFLLFDKMHTWTFYKPSFNFMNVIKRINKITIRKKATTNETETKIDASG
jgi:hypothetical protein